jgi:hypothetical protein
MGGMRSYWTPYECIIMDSRSRGGSRVMITRPDFIASAQQSLELIIPSLFGARAALDRVEPGDLELVIETLEGVANSLSVVRLALELARNEPQVDHVTP